MVKDSTQICRYCITEIDDVNELFVVVSQPHKLWAEANPRKKTFDNRRVFLHPWRRKSRGPQIVKRRAYSVAVVAYLYDRKRAFGRHYEPTLLGNFLEI